jgi:acyl-CoA thioester hydrolase
VKSFVYHHRVAFSETDAMAVVHHSNHIKYFEEARVEWLRDRGLIEIHAPYGPFIFAVQEVHARYLRPARFDDALATHVEARVEGARIFFQYAIWCERLKEWMALGSTTLVAVNAELRPTRLPASVLERFRKEPWSEVWPPK